MEWRSFGEHPHPGPLPSRERERMAHHERVYHQRIDHEREGRDILEGSRVGCYFLEGSK